MKTWANKAAFLVSVSSSAQSYLELGSSATYHVRLETPSRLGLSVSNILVFGIFELFTWVLSEGTKRTNMANVQSQNKLSSPILEAVAPRETKMGAREIHCCKIFVNL